MEKRQNIWKRGKEANKKFYELDIKGLKSTLSFLFGIIVTLIVGLPLIFVLYQLFETYGYHPNILYIVFFIAWAALMLFNGFSNYITVLLTKNYYPQNTQLASLDEKAIWFYQTFNYNFAITIIVMIVLVNFIV